MEKNIEERRRKVKELTLQGKSPLEIAKILQCPRQIVSNNQKVLRKRKEISGKDINAICNEYVGQEKKLKKLEAYVDECKLRLKQGQLKKEELPVLKKVVIAIDSYRDIIFYAKACIKLGECSEAIKIVNGNLQNESFTKEQQEKLKELSAKMSKSESKAIALYYLKKDANVDIECIARMSGLSKDTVLALRRKLITQNKKTTNDDGEEPKQGGR